MLIANWFVYDGFCNGASCEGCRYSRLCGLNRHCNHDLVDLAYQVSDRELDRLYDIIVNQQDGRLTWGE